MLLRVFYAVRSKRQLIAHMEFNLLFRWFVASTLTSRCGMLPVLEEPRAAARGDGAAHFPATLMAPAREGLLSSGHFSVNGMMIQAWSSMKKR